MFTSGPTPSATLMDLKFGSPSSQPSPTNTCSSALIDGANSGHATSPAKPAPSLHRTALYSMTYEDAAVNLRQIQCSALSLRRARVLPGVDDMLKGVLPSQSCLTAQGPSLSPNEQTYSPLPRRRRRYFNYDSRSTTTSSSHAQSPRQRVSVACTFCRARKLRCTPGPPPCEHCKRRSHPCIFEHQSQYRDQQPQNVSSSSTPGDWASLQ